MPITDPFELAFRRVRKEFKSKAKRTFLDDIRGQVEEDTDLKDTITRSPLNEKLKYFAVTFDRIKNDKTFSYSDFDCLLVAIDGWAGGNGIYKPSNQIRALRWNGTRVTLLSTLRHFWKLNPTIAVRRALVLPFPSPLVGHRIDRSVYMK